MAKLALIEPIIECVPYDNTIPSISKKDVDRGYYRLHALYDTWIFPWKYREVKINLRQIYLPSNHIGIISTAPQILRPNLIEAKVTIAPINLFPNGIEIRNGYGLLPYKIHAGDVIAILHMVPLLECHVI